jgi:diadenylate cyclase
MGALIVIGDGPDVLGLCSGGFLVDAEFTPQRLSELAKMDGAMILSSDCTRIARANVHLVPDPDIPTQETGTRHRTAERVGKQIDAPVISVSEELALVAIHRRGVKRTLEPVARVLSRADQALQILERYKARLDAVSGSLSALEVEDLVTVRDVASVLQRLEMVRRISEEIAGYVVELGVDGRLLTLQLEELTGGLGNDRELVIRDYLGETRGGLTVDQALEALQELTSTELLDLGAGAKAIGFTIVGDALDSAISPCGYRLLSKVPRLPGAIVDRLVGHFGSLQKLLAANLEELMDVEGVGEGRARAVREGLSRLAESSILERYV